MKKEEDISSRETRLQSDGRSWQSWCAQGTTESVASFTKWLEPVQRGWQGTLQPDGGLQDTVLWTMECQGQFEAGKWHSQIYTVARRCFGNVGNEIYFHGRKVKKGVTRWEASDTGLVRDGTALSWRPWTQRRRGAARLLRRCWGRGSLLSHDKFPEVMRVVEGNLDGICLFQRFSILFIEIECSKTRKKICFKRTEFDVFWNVAK